MTTSRDLLKEAIADAKAVKETAIANAKAALEEAFTPHLKSMFSAKINEMEEEEEIEVDENEELEEEITNETENTNESEEVVKELDVNEDEINLEELISELEKDEVEETINDPKDPSAHGNIAGGGENDENLSEVEAENEEEINIEDMSEDDLKNFIEDVIKDMIEAGEIEVGEEGEAGEEGEETGESIDEFLNEMEGKDLKEYGQEHELSVEDALVVICKTYPDNVLCKGVSENKTTKLKISKELEEAYSVINSMKKDINEVNLLNAKLLYTNKIFRNKSLTESQKINVLGAFDKATTPKEAKFVYELLLNDLKPTKNLNENLSRASKSITIPQTKQPIIESNDMIARFQKLAGIIK